MKRWKYNIATLAIEVVLFVEIVALSFLVFDRTLTIEELRIEVRQTQSYFARAKSGLGFYTGDSDC